MLLRPSCSGDSLLLICNFICNSYECLAYIYSFWTQYVGLNSEKPERRREFIINILILGVLLILRLILKKNDLFCLERLSFIKFIRRKESDNWTTTFHFPGGNVSSSVHQCFVKNFCRETSWDLDKLTQFLQITANTSFIENLNWKTHLFAICYKEISYISKF